MNLAFVMVKEARDGIVIAFDVCCPILERETWVAREAGEREKFASNALSLGV